MSAEDWKKMEETIKVWTDALLKKIELQADERGKKNWTGVPDGLKKHFREEFIARQMRWKNYEKGDIENAVRACWRFDIEFEVRKTGLFVLKEDNLPDLEVVRKTALDLEDKRKALQDFVWDINSVSRAIPYSPKKEFDVIISVDGIQYKNKEITDLYYVKEKEMKEIESERDICVALFKLIENKKIEVF